MKNRLVIVGASGHGKVIADIAMKNGYDNICFLDDSDVKECLCFPVIGKVAGIKNLDNGKTDFFIAIGNNKVREKIAREFKISYVNLIHPDATVGYGVSIGKGTAVMANAVINPCAKIGNHCIINTGSVIEHDNVIEDFAHISPGAALGGTVRVGEGCHVGIGASVRNNTNICPDCIIGAGAVVVKSITESGIYAGVPAKKIKD